MKVQKVKTQNFQCIRDSGDIIFDDHITVLVGENESGKSALLKALSYFNQGESFKDVDVSTMSGDIRQRLESGELSRDSVEMVAIWVELSDKDRRTWALPDQLGNVSTFRIVKTLDNQYKFSTADGEPLSKALAETRTVSLASFLEGLKKEVRNVYCGQVKRRGPLDQFVFLQREANEKNKDNLILFPESASDIWDDLQMGNWIQVTKIAEDPFGRNPRALNAGIKFDLETLLVEFIKAVQAGNADLSQAFVAFKNGLKELPLNHPLRDYLTQDVIDQLEALCTGPSEYDMSDIERGILSHMPRFVYVPVVEKTADSISLTELQFGSSQEPGALLATLLKIVGLRPEVAVTKEQAERIQILREKSRLLSERLREYWFKKDITVEFDFLNQDREIGMAVDSDGSFDPPSRRSQGFSSYASLFAKLAQLATMDNTVVLLDDPAVHLHPIAQKKILGLLEAQQYQIIVATHLPFLIDPEHLERIRVVRRTPAGSQIEQDWAKVEQSLLPVWGSLVGSFTGRVWLLVEGKNDREYYTALNQACKECKREHLSSDVVIFPGGGDQLQYAAQALHTRGMFFVAVLDGDRAGQESKKRIIDICGVDPQRIVTLNEIEVSQANPTVEDLFSPVFKTSHNVRSRGLSQAIANVEKGTGAFDDDTLNSFEKVFARANKALSQLR
jgi:predicted ATPase